MAADYAEGISFVLRIVNCTETNERRKTRLRAEPKKRTHHFLREFFHQFSAAVLAPHCESSIG